MYVNPKIFVVFEKMAIVSCMTELTAELTDSIIKIFRGNQRCSLFFVVFYNLFIKEIYFFFFKKTKEK
jgi:hypothetical protein